MESEIERLQAMLGSQDVWEKPTEPELTRDVNLSTDRTPGIKEEFPPYGYGLEDELKQFVRRVEDKQRPPDFPQYALQTGQEAPEGESFCPLIALTKYPYTYVANVDRDRVTTEFFAKGSFYKRPWDFFYIYSVSSTGRKAILLVPSRQFQHFLSIINEFFDIELRLPENAAEIGLLVNFPKDGTPRPRYLGRTTNPETADGLKQAIPSLTWRPKDEIPSICEPSDRSLWVFKKKIDLLLESEKKKKTATKERKKLERIAKQQAWNSLIKRVQRYLGIRGPHQGHNVASKDLGSSSKDYDIELPETSRAIQAATLHPITPDILDVEKYAPFDPEYSVIFISIDVESFERDHNLITEIGIATLDTADIATVCPGKGGTNWMGLIRARHFRIKEYEHLKNHEFVHGCAENFQFGQSEWLSIRTAPHEISKCFKFPYSKQTGMSGFDDGNPLEKAGTGTKRNVILVGHDIATDISYLRKLGYDPYNLANLHEMIDTSLMYRALEREPHPRNLGSILANLGIAGWYLHNAGNDAVYTLQAMIGIAIKAKVERSDQQFWATEMKARIAESAKTAVESALEAQEGWSSDGGDGGSHIVPRAQASSNRTSTEQNETLSSPWRQINANTTSSSANSK